jgi:hypothetical protein
VQDISLVFDAVATAKGSGTIGLTLSRPGAKLETTGEGDFHIQGQSRSGTRSGFKFGNAACVDDSGNFISNTVLTQDSTWLNNSANLTGGLILVNPQGVVYAHMNTIGTVRIRGNATTDIGPF